MRSALFLVPLLLAGAAPSDAVDSQPMLLTLIPVTGKSGKFAAIDIAMTFKGDSDGETQVKMPDSWGGAETLYRHITKVSVKGGTLKVSGNAAERVIFHKPGARVTLSYRVVPARQHARLGEGEQVNDYRPIIAPDYFQLIGNAIIANPSHIALEQPAIVKIGKMPSGATFASDLQHGNFAKPLTFNDLIESVSVGGDFRIIDAGGGLRLAMRGQFRERTHDQWVNAFTRIAAAQRSYWGAADSPFLVTVLPYEAPSEGYVSVGGTGRADAFAIFATTNASTDTLDLVLAHEMMHTWVPGAIGGLNSGDNPEPYWLSEGFTDFLTWRVLVRAGIWTPERFAAQMTAALAEYDKLSIRTMPNAQSAQKFWKDREAQRLPYLRGMLFATWADAELLRKSGGRTDFDDVMMEMLRQSKRGGGEDVVALFPKAMKEAGVATDTILAKAIERGEPIAFPPDLFAPCGTMEVIDRATFDRGFDVAATAAAGNVVSGTRVGSPAWKAGLRDGMKLLGRESGQLGNSQVELAYAVEDKGVRKTLRWMPEGTTRETIRRFAIADKLSGNARTACIKRLGGS